MYNLRPFEDNFFDSFFGDVNNNRLSTLNKFSVDISENDNEYLFEADLPGADKKDVLVDFFDNKLYIKYEKKEANDVNEKNYIRRERRYNKFERVFSMKDVNKDEIKAKLENGVLSVTVPKGKEESRKSINIE